MRLLPILLAALMVSVGVFGVSLWFWQGRPTPVTPAENEEVADAKVDVEKAKQDLASAYKFADRMGIESIRVTCEGEVTPVFCSAVLAGRPVTFECDNGCGWVALPEAE